jgi:hypothetical protein
MLFVILGYKTVGAVRISILFRLYRGGHFYWWRKLGYPEQTTEVSQVSDKRYHITLYRVDLAMSRIRTHGSMIAVVNLTKDDIVKVRHYPGKGWEKSCMVVGVSSLDFS